MEISAIKSERQYEEACQRVYDLMHETDELIEPGTPAGEEIELLAILIEKYEHTHFPIDPPDPVAAILFHMDQLNLKQKDLAQYFGGKTKVSEVLNRKRPLSLRTIALLHENLGIPLESLVQSKRKEHSGSAIIQPAP